MKSHKLILLATAAALAALAFPAAAVVDSDPVWNSVKGQPAPVLNVPRPADATGPYRPATVSVLPVSAPEVIEIVKKGQATGEILSGGSGATALGTFYGLGQWTNTGSAPLMVTTSSDNTCYLYNIAWQGGQAQLRDDCEWVSTSASYIVMPGSAFSITKGNGSMTNGGNDLTNLRSSVTALANNVTWAMTGINAYMGQTESVTVSTTYSVDACGGTQQTTTYRSYANYTISGPTGSPVTTSATSGPACFGSGGSGGDGG